MAEELNTTPVSNETVVHPLESSGTSFPWVSLIVFMFVVLLGVGTGYLLSHVLSSKTGQLMTSGSSSQTGALAKGTVVGSTDLTTFKDTATGVVQQGGINGEGQYHLVRPGGDSQNVYMTSSIVDLSQFVGKKVTVHGETQKAQYAGWLMDVGQVEVME